MLPDARAAPLFLFLLFFPARQGRTVELGGAYNRAETGSTAITSSDGVPTWVDLKPKVLPGPRCVRRLIHGIPRLRLAIKAGLLVDLLPRARKQRLAEICYD